MSRRRETKAVRPAGAGARAARQQSHPQGRRPHYRRDEQELEEEIDKNFREFVLPPQRRADSCRRCATATTFPLVRHFADLFARKLFSSSHLHRRRDGSSQQHWRGNIRELQNFAERLMIMTRGNGRCGDIPRAVSSAVAPVAAGSGEIDERRGQSWKPGRPGIQVGSERYLVAKLRE